MRRRHCVRCGTGRRRHNGLCDRCLTFLNPWGPRVPDPILGKISWMIVALTLGFLAITVIAQVAHLVVG